MFVLDHPPCRRSRRRSSPHGLHDAVCTAVVFGDLLQAMAGALLLSDSSSWILVRIDAPIVGSGYARAQHSRISLRSQRNFTAGSRTGESRSARGQRRHRFARPPDRRRRHGGSDAGCRLDFGQWAGCQLDVDGSEVPKICVKRVSVRRLRAGCPAARDERCLGSHACDEPGISVATAARSVPTALTS